MRHLLSAGDLSLGEVTEILDLAEEMSAVQDRPVKKLPALRGLVVFDGSAARGGYRRCNCCMSGPDTGESSAAAGAASWLGGGWRALMRTAC